MRVVVTGLMATYPAGGVVWDYGQYIVGFERLGFDVVYLEDPACVGGVDDLGRSYSDLPMGSVRFLAEALSNLPVQRPVSWHLRTPDGQTYGMSPDALRRTLSAVDIFVNVSGGCLLREDYAVCPRTVLIDTDPGLNHFVNYPAADRGAGPPGALGWRAHTDHLTYAELLGTPECRLPGLGISWTPTRPPVVLDCWGQEPPGRTWTTVMSWGSYNDLPPILDQRGQRYFAKEPEWALIESIPGMRPELEFAVAVRETMPPERLAKSRWARKDPRFEIPSAIPYRRFVQSSRGELSVAKNVYVATRSGWFSCRSVCYLAAGRPVVVQDTGFSRVIESGYGLMAYDTTEEALARIDEVEANYASHAEAARGVAETYFSADRVLGELLSKAGL